MKTNNNLILLDKFEPRIGVHIFEVLREGCSVYFPKTIEFTPSCSEFLIKM